ncbi:hypothetical protein D3C85_1143620 [compost metagenome]
MTSTTAQIHSSAERLVTRANSAKLPIEQAATAPSSGNINAERVLRTRPPSINAPRNISPPTASHCGQYGRLLTGPARTPLSWRSASNNPQ